ncbi:MAG: Nif3-like dinuclear metal center hexameric protein [Phycisphaerae bacterium]
MICRDIHDHLKTQGTWVNWESTADTFKAGDSGRAVTTVAVAWKASWAALKEAHARGAELFISHESICVCASNNSTQPESVSALPSEKPKFDWLEQSGLVVYRCHDLWDRFPKIGIRDTWQRGLELGGKIVNEVGSLLVTEIAPIRAATLAQHVLTKIRPLGQNGLLLAGDGDKIVRRVATGAGVTVDPIAMIDAGADVGIITDDYYCFVRMGTHARELDFPTITVNHGVSEEWGVVNLARYLAVAFPQLEVFHIPQTCAYAVVM